MGLKDLSDDQLKEFLADPGKFLESETNYDQVFDLADPSVKQRVEKFQKEMNISPSKLRIDRPDLAK